MVFLLKKFNNNSNIDYLFNTHYNPFFLDKGRPYHESLIRIKYLKRINTLRRNIFSFVLFFEKFYLYYNKILFNSWIRVFFLLNYFDKFSNLIFYFKNYYLFSTNESVSYYFNSELYSFDVFFFKTLVKANLEYSYNLYVNSLVTNVFLLKFILKYSFNKNIFRYGNNRNSFLGFFSIFPETNALLSFSKSIYKYRTINKVGNPLFSYFNYRVVGVTLFGTLDKVVILKR